jgi:hypothetical protein
MLTPAGTTFFFDSLEMLYCALKSEKSNAYATHKQVTSGSFLLANTCRKNISRNA